MSTKFTDAIAKALKQAEIEVLKNRHRVLSSMRTIRITRHIRVGKATYEALKEIAKENKTTISKTADSIFAISYARKSK